MHQHAAGDEVGVEVLDVEVVDGDGRRGWRSPASSASGPLQPPHPRRVPGSRPQPPGRPQQPSPCVQQLAVLQDKYFLDDLQRQLAGVA